ncbi:MAG: PAS domain S-box protein [Methanoregula sp.]
MKTPAGFIMGENSWRSLILALSVGVLALTVWCLAHGITIIFMHLYYFPIILLAYRYRWKGFVFCVLLSLAYVGLVTGFDLGNGEVILGAVYRCAVFIGIAAVIAYLSEQLQQIGLSEKQSTERIARQQQFQESVIANANVWISVLTPEGTPEIWNEAAESISGYKKEDVLGRRTIWKQLYPDPEYRKKVTADIQRILSKDTLLENFETEIRCADGSIKTIVWNTRGLRDNSGIISRYISIGRDITAQKAAELRATESSRFLGAMIDTLPIPIFFKDSHGKYLGCNPPFEEYLGIRRDQIVGKGVYDLSPKDLADTYAAADQQMFDHPAPQRYETRVQYADGSRHDVIFYKAPFFQQDGSLGGLIGAFLDITERKKIEDALRESESFNRGLIENLPEYLAVYGMDGNILYVNPASARALGYNAESLVGTPVFDYVAKEYVDTVKSKMAARLAGDTSGYEIELISKEDTRRSVIVKATPIQYRNNPAILLLLFDITERKRAETALRESEERYRAFFSTSQDCVFITTMEGSWVDFNNAAVELFGYENREDLFKTKIPQIYANPHDREAHIRYIRENGYSFEYPVDLRKKDGTIIHTLITTVARKNVSGAITGFQGSIRDITERKAAQERIAELLKTQEEQVRIINTSPAVAFLWKAEENWPVEMVSENISQFGYTREDFLSGRIQYSTIIHPEDLARVSQEVEYNSSHHIDDNSQEYRILGKNQEVFWVADFTHIRRNSEGIITHYEGVILDITGRKRAEDAVQAAVRINQQIDTMSVAECMSYTLDEAERITTSKIGFFHFINPDEQTINLIAWSTETRKHCFIPKEPERHYPVEKAGVWADCIRERRPVIHNDYASLPYKKGLPEGHVVVNREMVVPIFNEKKIVAIIGVGNKPVDYDEKDISVLTLLAKNAWTLIQRKKAEDERERIRLWQSGVNRILESVLAPAPLDQKLKIITDGVVETFGADFCRIWLIEKGDLCTTDCMHAGVTEGPHVCRYRDKCLHLKASSGRYTHINGKGHRRVPFGAYKIGRIASGEETKFLTNDVEHDPRVHDHEWAKSLGLVAFAGYQLKPPDGDVLGVFALFSDFSISPDMDSILEGLSRAISLAVQKDTADKALRESENKYRTLFENMLEGFAYCRMVYDETGKPSDWVYLDVNAAFERLTGLHDIIGKRVLETIPDIRTLTPELFEMYGRVASTGISETFEIDFKPLNTWLKVSVFSPEKDYFVAVFEDITGRKRAEDALDESRQLFADIISFLPDPTFVIDNEGTVLAWNRALEQLSGVKSQDIIGKADYEYSIWMYGKRRPALIDLVLHPDQDAGRMNYSGIRWEGRTVTAQAEITRNGHTVPLSLVASPLIDLQGLVTGAIESMRDISVLKEAEANLARFNANLERIIKERTQALHDEIVQRKYAEQEVQDALSYTRSVIEANPDIMVVLDRKGMVLDVNTATETLTGIPREQLIGTSYSHYLVDDSTPRDILSRLPDEGRIEYTVRLIRGDGHITPLSVNATLFRGKEATDTRIIVAAHDITRQKQDEDAIRASLDEKVLLLREIHHRVKNNLQIIISLTNLQMRQTEDPVAKQIMAETQNRVRAMSLVHEKLYRSESLSRIDFADYTRFLATQLTSFYAVDTRRVRLDLAMDRIMIDINTAVPLGLIMNELVSNALKHGFPDNRQGTIHISGKIEGDFITLVVSDDGIGIPADLDWKNAGTLGLRLINSLVDQVSGTLELKRDGGTMFIITLDRDAAPEENA